MVSAQPTNSLTPQQFMSGCHSMLNQAGEQAFCLVVHGKSLYKQTCTSYYPSYAQYCKGQYTGRAKTIYTSRQGPGRPLASCQQRRHRARGSGVGSKEACLVSVLATNASINLNPRVHASIITHLPELADLLHLVLNELLTAKSRVDCRQRSCSHFGYYRSACKGMPVATIIVVRTMVRIENETPPQRD